MTRSRGNVPFLILAGALTAILPMSFDFYLPSFPDIADQFDTSVSSVQYTLSAALIGVAFGQLLYGPLVDRFGRKAPSLAGLAIFIIASIACALAPSLPILIALRFLQALGGSGAVVGSRAMTRDRFSGLELARAFSFIYLVFGIAPVLAPTLGAILLTWLSWRGLFVFLAVFGIICFIGLFMARESHSLEHRTDHGFVDSLRAYRGLLRSPVFLWSTLTGMFVGAGLFSFISGAPAALIDSYGLNTVAFAVTFGLISLTLFAMSTLNSRLVRRYEVHRLILIFSLVQLTGTALLLIVAISHAPWWLYAVVLALPVCCVGLLMPNAMASALEPFPHAAGSAAAFAGMAQMVGAATAAAVLASIRLQPPVALAVGFMVACLGVVACALVLRGAFARERAVADVRQS